MNNKNTQNNHPVHMLGQTNDDEWIRGDGTHRRLKDASVRELQYYKRQAQRKEMFYFKRSQIFSVLAEEIDREAASRGVELRDQNTKFHQNTRTLKEAIKKP